MSLTFKKMAELIYIMPTISRMRLKNYRHNKNELELVKLIESEKIKEANVLIDKYLDEKNLHLLGDPIDRLSQIIIREDNTYDVISKFNFVKDNVILIKKILSLYPDQDDYFFLSGDKCSMGFKETDTNETIRKRIESFIFQAMIGKTFSVSNNLEEQLFGTNSMMTLVCEKVYESLKIKAKQTILDSSLKEPKLRKGMVI